MKTTRIYATSSSDRNLSPDHVTVISPAECLELESRTERESVLFDEEDDPVYDLYPDED